ncbi:hypothetical protein PAUR_b0676 [Pseudoalteromonas aurantia 208]|uniref:Uncharacterized protein n=1 Tax=Pseudoalteromonas aurantia 208 TaxID=1314867 RepID=A0ABR9EI24_9GAMM|nr:hypothetical protein [Pseudoalteromonas aurantia 208]
MVGVSLYCIATLPVSPTTFKAAVLLLDCCVSSIGGGGGGGGNVATSILV